MSGRLDRRRLSRHATPTQVGSTRTPQRRSFTPTVENPATALDRRVDIERSLTAAGVSLANSPSVRAQRTAQDGYQAWQQEVVELLPAVSEAFYASQFVARAAAQARLFVGVPEPTPSNPNALRELPADHQLQVFLARLLDSLGGSEEFITRAGTLLRTLGEATIVGISPENAPNVVPLDGGEWFIAAPQDVKRTGDAFRVPSSIGKGHRTVPAPQVTAARLWDPDVFEFRYPSSPLKWNLPIMREIAVLSAATFAMGRSRLFSGGILAMPSEMKFPEVPEDADHSALDGFVVDLITAMSDAIERPGTAEALTPIVITGPGDTIDKIKHLTFAQDLPEKLLELRDSAVSRLATSLDLPSEVILGDANTSHWSLWRSDSRLLEQHAKPLLGLICSSLTQGLLRTLSFDGSSTPSPETRRAVISFDLSHVVVRTNRSPEAQAAHDRNAISDEALRDAGGFTDEQAATPSELKLRALRQAAASQPDLYLRPYLASLGFDADDIPQVDAAQRGPAAPPRTPETPRDLDKRDIPSERDI